ncbi:hypothetical protein LCGC14_2189700 [marine sediment metagenome]|uniref:Uncharacterized protein n=1 Tax=marine sediment metagenome TaxID=412755 RepID=A0A0F9DJU7_9ZZZZ
MKTVLTRRAKEWDNFLESILKERENFEYVNVTDVTPEKKAVPPRGGHDY